MWTYTGTVAFSAPEIFATGEYNESVDMWSAGVVLYTMLCGSMPFEAEYLQDLIVLIKKGEYDFPSNPWDSISEQAKDLIRSCLQKDPQLRITPDKALLHTWITNKQNISPLIGLKNLKENKKKYLTKFAAYQELGLVKSLDRKNTFSLFNSKAINSFMDNLENTNRKKSGGGSSSNSKFSKYKNSSQSNSNDSNEEDEEKKQEDIINGQLTDEVQDKVIIPQRHEQKKKGLSNNVYNTKEYEDYNNDEE